MVTRCRKVKLRAQPTVRAISNLSVRFFGGGRFRHVFLKTFRLYRAGASPVLARTGGESAARCHTKFCLHVKFYGVSACSKVRLISYEFVRRQYLPLTEPKRLPTFWHVDSTYLHVRRVVPLALRLKSSLSTSTVKHSDDL